MPLRFVIQTNNPAKTKEQGLALGMKLRKLKNKITKFIEFFRGGEIIFLH